MGRARMLFYGLALLMLGALSACKSEDPNSPTPAVTEPVRWWKFSKYVAGTTQVQAVRPEQLKVGGELSDSAEYGATVFRVFGQGPIAQAKVFSSGSGQTYWVSTQGPNATLVPGATIGSVAEMLQFQAFRKRDQNATLTLVVSKTYFDAIDANVGFPTTLECPGQTPFMLLQTFCSYIMKTWVEYDLAAFSPESGKTLVKTGGIAELHGFGRAWNFFAHTSSGASSHFWDEKDFKFNRDADDSHTEAFAQADLLSPVTIRVPLESVPIGGTIYLLAQVKASTFNHRQRESYLAAYFRDPVGTDGLTFDYSGLEPVETPAEKPVEPAPLSAPECTGGTGAGTLQFESADFTANEAAGPGGIVVVTRIGGTSGAVSATVNTGGGSAVDGSDYSAVSTTVFFADGDDGARVVRIPILGDASEEPDETVTLTLSAPKGCASLGSQTTAQLTIQDDDQPIAPPVGFTVGGSVTGLAGSGLELSNFGATVTPSADGPFSFATLYSDGLPYEVHVTTQPSNPDQVCTVTHDSGTISGANITDVQVDCVTQQSNGALDPTYGTAGKVTTGMPSGAVAMALQTDGKAVLVGGQTLARYNTNGTLDGTFGTGGLVTVGFNGGLQDEVLGLAIQSDGKIVVVGFTAVGGQDDFAVARYSSTGQLDPSFGSGGNVHTDFGGQTDRAYAPLILPSGDIVVAGHAALPITGGFGNDFAVARYTSAGVLVPGFGNGGKVTTNIAGRTDLAFAAALQSDGKIIVAGRVADGGGDDPDVGMVRYNDNGSLDPDFGLQGIVRNNLSGNWDEASDIVIQPDGKIVLSVEAVVGSTFDFEVARFGSDGLLDPAFGNQGIASTSFGTTIDVPKGLALQSDGKIVVVGNSALVSNDLTVARFTAAGVLDSSFGTGGKVIVDFFGSADGAEAIAIQADGKILAAGFARNGTQTGVGIVRIVP